MSSIVKLADTPRAKWVRRWAVPSHSDPRKAYVVAETEEHEFGCSCPVWKFRRQQCKHITDVLREMEKPEPKYQAVAIVSDDPQDLDEISRASFVIV